MREATLSSLLSAGVTRRWSVVGHSTTPTWRGGECFRIAQTLSSWGNSALSPWHRVPYVALLFCVRIRRISRIRRECSVFYARVAGTEQVSRPERSAKGGVDEVELLFQRCAWCRTMTVRRLLCPACWSTDLVAERSEGVGVVVPRRYGPTAPEAVWPVRMLEGFVVRCVVDGPPHAVRPGIRVRLARAAATITAPDGRIVRREPVVRLCDEVSLDGWTRGAG
ncbi:zinc ribbon domain-containing protein [Streptomyces sp. NBC_01320]|nr:zinc ribbon domain-containing protein [Streptomyces sp. NBC_01320]